MRRGWLFLGFWLAATGLHGDPPAPPPSTSQQELQQPLSLDDGKPTQTAPLPEPSGWRAAGSLLVVAGLAGASLWALKKYGKGRLPGTGGGKLQLEETLALGERRYVSILRCEEDRFLVAMTPQGISLLSHLDGIPGKAAPSFGENLAQQMALPRPIHVRDAEAMLRNGQS